MKFKSADVRAIAGCSVHGDVVVCTQKAALISCGEEEWSDLNLRVDDHADPLAELERLENVSRERFVHFMRMLPNRSNRVGVTDRQLIESKIAEARAAERSS